MCRLVPDLYSARVRSHCWAFLVKIIGRSEWRKITGHSSRIYPNVRIIIIPFWWSGFCQIDQMILQMILAQIGVHTESWSCRRSRQKIQVASLPRSHVAPFTECLRASSVSSLLATTECEEKFWPRQTIFGEKRWSLWKSWSKGIQPSEMGNQVPNHRSEKLDRMNVVTRLPWNDYHPRTLWRWHWWTGRSPMPFPHLSRL
jgi:hypothetical protein